MSLPRDGMHPVPGETARVAHAVFPRGKVYLRLRDELDTVFDDELFRAVQGRSGPSMPAKGNQRCIRGNARLSASCSSWRICAIARQQRPCAPGLTGSTRGGWS
jgi:hypothetical protein